MNIFTCANIALKLLLLSGDVEVNPGPTTRSTNSQTDQTIHALLRKLDEGQDQILSALKTINERLTATEETLTDLATRITKSEEMCASIPELLSSVGTLIKSSTDATIQLSNMEGRLSDAEDRSRRCNLLFYGIPEKEEETWADSEGFVADICKKHIKINLVPNDIETVHRKVQPDKPRPVIVNFSQFKIKEAILSNGFKLKDTPYSVAQDYCFATRTAQRELLRFAREHGGQFKLRYKNVVIGKKSYPYDATRKEVKEIFPRDS
ncbi:hypothetical protein HPB48_017525 [Haemaphysalis longicornis]|uniref:Tick transposon n=1 Tax=Haemaphysalis longicornis TaxID=44386 RepID=A0A9J6GL55_HAELO|nr:hypothetical protein HPB48_017525 [Haemaphysalis longicornis]